MDPMNATLRFRASCSEVDGRIVELLAQWYIGVAAAEFPERSSFTPISYGNKVWLLGGTSKSSAQLDEIWFSTYTGIATYTKLPCKISTSFPHIISIHIIKLGESRKQLFCMQ